MYEIQAVVCDQIRYNIGLGRVGRRWFFPGIDRVKAFSPGRPLSRIIMQIVAAFV